MTPVAPCVVFTADDGSVVEFRSRLSSASRTHHEGQSVTVVYEKASPSTTAEIDCPAPWQPAGMSAIVAVLLLFAALAVRACS